VPQGPPIVVAGCCSPCSTPTDWATRSIAGARVRVEPFLILNQRSGSGVGCRGACAGDGWQRHPGPLLGRSPREPSGTLARPARPSREAGRTGDRRRPPRSRADPSDRCRARCLPVRGRGMPSPCQARRGTVVHRLTRCAKTRPSQSISASSSAESCGISAASKWKAAGSSAAPDRLATKSFRELASLVLQPPAGGPHGTLLGLHQKTYRTVCPAHRDVCR